MCKIFSWGREKKIGASCSPERAFFRRHGAGIAEFYVSSNALATFRFLFILLVGFYGFFSIHEINSFCLKDVTINADHKSIYVAKRKTDQCREVLPGLGNLRAQFPLLN